MAYSPHQRARALQVVARVGYAAASRLTGISEGSLRRWAAEAAEKAVVRR